MSYEEEEAMSVSEALSSRTDRERRHKTKKKQEFGNCTCVCSFLVLFCSLELYRSRRHETGVGENEFRIPSVFITAVPITQHFGIH
jgi:hypothetical protein